jgi:transcriptional regulator with XRE-family HTH domain
MPNIYEGSFKMAGPELRKLRLLAGQTQLDLERSSGVDQSRISLVETGRAEIAPEEAKRLVRAILGTMKQRMAEVEAIAKMYAAA